MAADALCLILYDMEEGGAVPPEPSDVRSIVCAENQLVTLIRCDTIEYRKFFDNLSGEKDSDHSGVAEHYGGKTGGQFFHDPAKCTESGAAYLTDDKQESGDRASPLSFAVLRHSTAAVGDKVHIYQ